MWCWGAAVGRDLPRPRRAGLEGSRKTLRNQMGSPTDLAGVWTTRPVLCVPCGPWRASSRWGLALTPDFKKPPNLCGGQAAHPKSLAGLSLVRRRLQDLGWVAPWGGCCSGAF